MSSLYTHRDANVRRTWFLMTVFFIIVIGIGWAFSYIYNAPGILLIAVVFSIIMNLIGYWKSDTIVMKIAGARQIEKADNPELWNIVENLSITAGLPMPKVYVINEPVPNAFATGRDPAHGAVAVTSGLLHTLNRTELEGVIAHELAHIGNRDTLLQTVVVILVGFIALLSDLFLRMSFFGGMGNDRQGGGNAVLALVGVALIILSPIIATLIRLAISRKREFLADASGALLTRYPDGLASALEKISAHSGKMKRANHATAHLFIANPFGSRLRGGKEKVSFLTKLFMTHPPVHERVRALKGMA